MTAPNIDKQKLIDAINAKEEHMLRVGAGERVD